MAGTELSPREKQIVARILQAKANKQIAWELGLSEGTVKQYLFHIFRKAGVPNRVGLAVKFASPATLEAV
jgi:DNA-binding CsgD family transcriptional regulator